MPSAAARDEVAAMLLDLAARVSADGAWLDRYEVGHAHGFAAGRLAGAREERARIAAMLRGRAADDRRAGSFETAGVWEAAARVCEEEAR